MKEILKDSKLKIISDALGNVPPCFAALLPQEDEGNRHVEREDPALSILLCAGPLKDFRLVDV